MVRTRGEETGEVGAFFYGTLMHPGILNRVIWGTYTSFYAEVNPLTTRNAILHDYQRRKVKNADYPGITHTPGKKTRGVYVEGLTEGDFYRLDMFEGNQYEKHDVEVSILGPDNEVVASTMAKTYVFTEGDEYLEEEEWDFDDFLRDKLQYWHPDSEEYNEVDAYVSQENELDQKLAEKALELDQREAVVETNLKELQKWEKQLMLEEKDVHEKKPQLDWRETELSITEKGVIEEAAELEKKLDQKEMKVNTHAQMLQKIADKLTKKEQALAEKERELQLREEAVAEKDKASDEKQKELDEKEKIANEKDNTPNEKEKELQKREKGHEINEKGIVDQITEWEKKLHDRDEKIDQRAQLLRLEAKELDQKAKMLSERENKLTKRDKSLAEKEKTPDEQRKEPTEKERELDEREKLVAEKEHELEQKEYELNMREFEYPFLDIRKTVQLAQRK